MLIQNIISYTDFQHYLEKYKYIIINISAPWCKPCNLIKPNIEKFISAINDIEIIYLKIDNSIYEEYPLFETFFHMKKIPYFAFIRNKEILENIVSGDFENVSKKIFNFTVLIKEEEKKILEESFNENNDF